MAPGLPPIIPPDLLDPEPIPDPRLASPQMDIPPPEFMPEMPQYLPPERPGMFENTFSPFGNTAALAAMMRRGAPPGAFLLAGLLHGLGQQAQRRRAVDEEQRQEMNRRFETAAAFRNRANLAASGRREATRLSEMHKASERERLKVEQAQERRRIDASLARDLELGPDWVGRMIDDLPPELRAKPLQRVSLITVPGPHGEPVTVRAPSSLASSMGGDELTDDAVDMYAHQLASKGKSGISVRDVSAMRRVANRAAALYKGINLARNEALYNANKNSLSSLTKLRDGIGAFIETAERNVKVLDEYATKIGGYDSPLANRSLRWFQKNMQGSPEMAAYDAARKTVATEYTRILTTLSGSGQITDTAQKELDSILRGDYGLKQMREVLDVFARDARNRDTAYADRISEITGRVANPTGGAGVESGYVRVRDKDGKTYFIPRSKRAEALSEPGVVEVP